MNQTIRCLSEIIRANPLIEKLLFVPSYSIGHQIGEYLSKSGISWINLRVTTIAGYAQELLALEIGEEGIRLIGSHEKNLIVEKIYRESDLPERDRYFNGAEEIPGILKCLANALHEMTMEGFNEGNINPGAFIVAGKGKELVWLHKAYNRFLKENKLIDHAGLIQKAFRKLEKEKQPEDGRLVIVLSDFPLSKLEKDLIRFLAGKKLIVIQHDLPVESRLPVRFFEPPSPSKRDIPNPSRDIELMPWLFNSEKSPGPIQDGTVSLFHALGESNEIREVFRRIFRGKIPLDQVEILVTSLEPYVSMIYEIAASLNVPVTFSSGIPITFTRPGRALTYYLNWQAEDFPASYLIRLFSGGYLNIDGLEIEGGKPSPSKASAIIREASIGWGRERYSKRLKALSESYRLKAEEKREEGEEDKALQAEKTASIVEGVAQFVKEIIGTVPVTAQAGTVTTRELFSGGLDFLNRFCRTASESDGMAKSKLRDILESLIQSPSLSRTGPKAAQWLQEMIEGVSVGHSAPSPGCIHVAHYSTGGYSGRDQTFILGLDQTKFPGAMLQDPVVLDIERKQLGNEMVLSGEILYEKIYTLAKVLSSLQGKLTLSYPCRDLQEDRELFPSSILLGIYRLITGQHHADYGALARFLGKPAGFIPESDSIHLNDWEWWLGQKEKHYTSDSIHKSYPNLLSGEVAEKEREADVFSVYDGWAPSMAGKMDPFHRKKILSCSQLENLAKCPYAYFIRYVLGIEAMEEMEKDFARWLDPLQRGKLLHEVFHRFMEELRARGERPSLKKHLDLMTDIAMKEIECCREEVPPASELTFNREVGEIKQTLQIFLRDEEERCKNVEPSLFELSFGIPESQDDGVSTKGPIEIKLNDDEVFLLRGRIDRVDRSGEHEYEILDYKTGSTWGYQEQGYLNHGKHLQHALYAMAAEILLRKHYDKKTRVVRSGYYFPTTKGHGLLVVRSNPVREELSEVLRDLFELLRKGVFPPASDKDPCNFCDYGRICGGPGVAVKRFKEKLEKDSKLKPINRLKDHV